jgi:NADP-dependent 3-hydroxy acid dehydrogenase YdfG
VGALDGKVAIVTGASSGIGEATARALAGEGAKLALLARRHERLTALADEIERDGGEALAIEGDIADHGKVEALVGQVKGQFGGLHILVNNAGVMLLGPVEGGARAGWGRLVEV